MGRSKGREMSQREVGDGIQGDVYFGGSGADRSRGNGRGGEKLWIGEMEVWVA